MIDASRLVIPGLPNLLGTIDVSCVDRASRASSPGMSLPWDVETSMHIPDSEAVRTSIPASDHVHAGTIIDWMEQIDRARGFRDRLQNACF